MSEPIIEVILEEEDWKDLMKILGSLTWGTTHMNRFHKMVKRVDDRIDIRRTNLEMRKDGK